MKFGGDRDLTVESSFYLPLQLKNSLDINCGLYYQTFLTLYSKKVCWILFVDCIIKLFQSYTVMEFGGDRNLTVDLKFLLPLQLENLLDIVCRLNYQTFPNLYS